MTGNTSELPAPRRSSRWITWAAWAYLVLLVGVWLGMLWLNERWWPATLLLFVPRWPWALPLIVLGPLACGKGRRILLPVGLAVMLVGGPLWGLCVPLAPLVEAAPQGLQLRVLSCNTAGRKLRPEALQELLRTNRPDVVALQEWHADLEPEVFRDPGWHVRAGSSLCLASRFPIDEFDRLPDENGWRDLLIRCNLTTPSGRVRVGNLHLPTARWGLEAVLEGKGDSGAEMAANTALRRRESGRALHWVAAFDGPLLIAGDFNMPTESTLYQEQWGRFSNAFSRAGLGWGGTKRTRWHSVRIDHILAGPGWRFRQSWIGPDVGSDHRPVLADVHWVGLETAPP